MLQASIEANTMSVITGKQTASSTVDNPRRWRSGVDLREPKVRIGSENPGNAMNNDWKLGMTTMWHLAIEVNPTQE